MTQIISDRKNNIQNVSNKDVDNSILSMTYYNYEEGDTPEIFFVTFSWNCAIKTCSEINWNNTISNSAIINNNNSQEIDDSGVK